MELPEEQRHVDDLPTGTLMRIIYSVMVGKEERGMAAAGYGDVHVAHFAVLLRLLTSPGGSRTTDLAAWARITKPSMIYLINDLEEHGYVERLPDPLDKRAQSVRLTARGRAAAQVIRELNRQVEQSWARSLDVQKVERFKLLLRELAESLHEWEED
jgi:DNA-binding MarR family transcriptional regulator